MILIRLSFCIEKENQTRRTNIFDTSRKITPKVDHSTDNFWKLNYCRNVGSQLFTGKKTKTNTAWNMITQSKRKKTLSHLFLKPRQQAEENSTFNCAKSIGLLLTGGRTKQLAKQTINQINILLFKNPLQRDATKTKKKVFFIFSTIFADLHSNN